jgi:hypothetical protein
MGDEHGCLVICGIVEHPSAGGTSVLAGCIEYRVPIGPGNLDRALQRVAGKERLLPI